MRESEKEVFSFMLMSVGTGAFSTGFAVYLLLAGHPSWEPVVFGIMGGLLLGMTLGFRAILHSRRFWNNRFGRDIWGPLK